MVLLAQRIRNRRFLLVLVCAGIILVGLAASLRDLALLQQRADEEEYRLNRDIAELKRSNEVLRNAVAERAKPSEAEPVPVAARENRAYGIISEEGVRALVNLMDRGSFPGIYTYYRVVRTGLFSEPLSRSVQDSEVPAFMIDASAALAPRFSELFDIDSRQERRVQDALYDYKRQLDTESVALLSVQNVSPDEITLEIPAIPNAGRLRDETLATIREILGDTRFELLDLLIATNYLNSNGGMGALLDDFGARARTYRIRRTQPGILSIQRIDGRGSSALRVSSPGAFQAYFGPIAVALPSMF